MGNNRAISRHVPVWAATEMRPDLSCLPYNVAFQSPIGKGGRNRSVSATISRSQVVLNNGNGQRTVSMKAYAGLSIAIVPAAGNAARVAAMVILEHEDPALSVPLFVAHDSADIVAVWKKLGDLLGCALLVAGIEGDCRIPVILSGLAAMNRTAPRRSTAVFAGASASAALPRMTFPAIALQGRTSAQIIALH